MIKKQLFNLISTKYFCRIGKKNVTLQNENDLLAQLV